MYQNKVKVQFISEFFGFFLIITFSESVKCHLCYMFKISVSTPLHLSSPLYGSVS